MPVRTRSRVSCPGNRRERFSGTSSGFRLRAAGSMQFDRIPPRPQAFASCNWPKLRIFSRNQWVQATAKEMLPLEKRAPPQTSGDTMMRTGKRQTSVQGLPQERSLFLPARPSVFVDDAGGRPKDWRRAASIAPLMMSSSFRLFEPFILIDPPPVGYFGTAILTFPAAPRRHRKGSPRGRPGSAAYPINNPRSPAYSRSPACPDPGSA